MKYWTPCLVAHIVILIITWQSVCSQSQDSSDRLVTHAQTIDHLQHVLGPNYRLFVAAYWRYMISSCDIFATRIAEDTGFWRLNKYCKYLNNCPLLYPTQSCLIQLSVYSINWTCCREPHEQTTPATLATSTQLRDVSKTAETTFNLRDQQTCNYGRVFPSGKIFGGTAAREREFPWIAMLVRSEVFLCECIVLDARHVLTTAHCFDLHTDLHYYHVIAGKYTSSLTEIDPTEQRVAVVSFVKHENYDRDRTWNDIALLELAQPLEFGDAVMPACLPSPSDKLEVYCTVAGWGRTEENELPAVLMKVELQAYNRTQCFEQFKDTATDLNRYLHDGAICAANGRLGQKDACKGDSGSPLMCIKTTQTSAAWFVFGIVSNGNSCALPGEPGIYVNIQYYLDWINTTIHSLS